MKTIFGLSFGAHRVPGGAETILGPSGCADAVAKVDEYDFQGIHGIDVEIELDDADPRIPKLIELVTKYDEGPWYWRRDVYTEDEFQSARLLTLAPDLNLDVFGGPRLGTTYDMSNACPTCGTGARQTSPMMLDSKYVKKIKGLAAAASCYRDTLIRDKLVKHLEAAGVTGLSLQDVYSRRKSGETIQLPRKQIIANHVLPPMHPSSLLDPSDACKTCRRGGIDLVDRYPLRFAYRAKDLADIPDVNVTWEWFGDVKFNGDVSKALFAAPWMLVTPKVMNILRVKDGPDAFHWIPIRVVDE